MRITDLLVFDRARLDTARAREAAEAAQQRVSTGTRIAHPGDDPAGAGLAVAFRMSSERLGAIQAATATAADELNAADGALDGVTNALTRARELAVQFANDTYSAADRAVGGQEVAGLFTQVVSNLNLRFGNRYLFGGTRDAAPPFDAAGTYSGSTGAAAARQVEIAPGVYQDASVRADVAVLGAGGGTNVLDALRALQHALEAGDGAAVQQSVDGIDAALRQVAATRAEAGTSADALGAASAAAKIASGDDEVRAAKQGEVDLADAAIQLQATQNALQAALAASAQGFRASLLDYLR